MPLQDHLPPLSREFVAHFGEMGSKWGINRTVGQIYALIFISPRALNADEIAEQLEISVKTVDLYRARVMKRMQAERLADLVGMACAAGLVDPLDLRGSASAQSAQAPQTQQA
jgi:DNA-binding transcriptional regulator GbsR (MarR family)